MAENILAFVDTETTHLDAEKGRVIEFACALATPGPKFRELDRYVVKLNPTEEDLANASPEALEINGFARASVWGGVSTNDQPTWEHILAILTGRIMVVQNFPFDTAFIREEFKRNKVWVGPSPWDRRYLECYSYCHLLDQLFGCGMSLDNAYKATGAPDLPKHSAMHDVERMLHIYRFVSDRFSFGETALRVLRS